MIVSSFESYKNELSGVGIPFHFTGSRGSTLLGSLYQAGVVSAYAAPTTATALYYSSLPYNQQIFERPFVSESDGSTSYNILGARISPAGGSMLGGAYILCDRLSHQGGLNATGTGAQTTNLPTAALPRYTDGRGVLAAIEIHTLIGTTATTATVSYTNQDGISGRTTPEFTIGSNGWREAGRLLLLPLQEGDTGVRSVESVTLTATTGTAGAFGIVLFKPLCIFPMTGISLPNNCDFITGNFIGQLQEISKQSFLFFAGIISFNVNSFTCAGQLLTTET